MLVEAEDLYEPLYDLMNQSFAVRFGRRRVSVRLGREEERGGVLVADTFRLLLVADARSARGYPIALRQRLEMHAVAARHLLGPGERATAARLEAMIRDFTAFPLRRTDFTPPLCFPGFVPGTVASLVLADPEAGAEALWARLLGAAALDAAIRAPESRLARAGGAGSEAGAYIAHMWPVLDLDRVHEGPRRVVVATTCAPVSSAACATRDGDAVDLLEFGTAAQLRGFLLQFIGGPRARLVVTADAQSPHCTAALLQLALHEIHAAAGDRMPDRQRLIFLCRVPPGAPDAGGVPLWFHRVSSRIHVDCPIFVGRAALEVCGSRGCPALRGAGGGGRGPVVLMCCAYSWTVAARPMSSGLRPARVQGVSAQPGHSAGTAQRPTVRWPKAPKTTHERGGGGHVHRAADLDSNPAFLVGNRVCF